MATGSITHVNFSSITGHPFTSVGLKELVYHLKTRRPLDKCYNFAGVNAAMGRPWLAWLLGFHMMIGASGESPKTN